MASVEGRRKGIFLPGKATPRQRAMYIVGVLICGGIVGLVLAADIAAGSTGVLDGALIGGFGAATVLFLGAVVLGRPIRWR